MAAIPEKPLEELIHELPPDLRQQVRELRGVLAGETEAREPYHIAPGLGRSSGKVQGEESFSMAR
jgi:hypothetical protein